MQIQLNAHLNAYSRAPFYGDWVRDVSVDGVYDPDIVWVRALSEERKTYWFPVNKHLFSDENVKKLFNRLDSTEKLLDESLSATYITPPYYSEELRSMIITFHNKYGWIDEQGKRQYKQVITLPSSYPDNKTIYRNLNNSSQLTLVDTPDDKTIKSIKQEVTTTVDTVGNPVQIELGKLRVDGIHVENPRSKWIQDNVLYGDSLDIALSHYDSEFDDLRSIVQGESGYLDPMPSVYVHEGEDIQKALSRWAIDQLNLQTELQIPNNTKILYPEEAVPANRDLYVFVASEVNNQPWKNSGKDTIVEATNNGVLGVVTGTNRKFGISIVDPYIDDTLTIHKGEMVVNGVEDEFKLVSYKGSNNSTRNLDQAYIQTEENKQDRADISQDADYKTLVMRTDRGNVRCSEPTTNDDAINLGWFNRQFMTDEELNLIIEEVLNA